MDACLYTAVGHCQARAVALQSIHFQHLFNYISSPASLRSDRAECSPELLPSIHVVTFCPALRAGLLMRAPSQAALFALAALCLDVLAEQQPLDAKAKAKYRHACPAYEHYVKFAQYVTDPWI